MLLILLFLLDVGLVLAFMLSGSFSLACMCSIGALFLAVLIYQEWHADKKYRDLKARINK